MRQIRLGSKVVTQDSPAYVICEIGNNHGGDLDTCLEMIRIAKQCGADAVKLQKRDNKTLYTSELYNAPYENENSYGATYGEHREHLEFGGTEYLQIQYLCEELDIDLMCTAFDIQSADFLSQFDLDAYKIASGGLTNIELIKHVASLGKPVILSTGGANMEDIERASAVFNIGHNMSILHCTASYPNKAEELNLNAIKSLMERCSATIIGYSNHHPSVKMCLSAYEKGARIIETHFTLSRASKGTDHGFSLEPKGLETLCQDLKDLHLAQGDGIKRRLPSEEKPILKMAQSVYAIKSIKKGDIYTKDNIGIKTPAAGLPAWKFGELLGKSANTDYRPEELIDEEVYVTPLTSEHLKPIKGKATRCM